MDYIYHVVFNLPTPRSRVELGCFIPDESEYMLLNDVTETSAEFSTPNVTELMALINNVTIGEGAVVQDLWRHDSLREFQLSEACKQVSWAQDDVHTRDAAGAAACLRNAIRHFQQAGVKS